MTQATALITGANGGLGRAIARRLATEHGFRIVAGARRTDAVAPVVEEIETAGGSAVAVDLDVADADSVAALPAKLAPVADGLRVLVNCAGINSMTAPGEQGILTARPETALREYDVNALGALRVTQAVVPILRTAGGGRIVNVSTEMAALSTMAGDFYPPAPSYRVSKVALNAITVLLARELAADGILVNAYSPGWLRTEMGGADAPFSAEEGAETAAWLATLPDDGSTGGFFAEMRRIGGALRLAW